MNIPPADASRTPQDANPIVVLMVHGTWARGANWTKVGTADGDRFQQSIRESVGREVEFPEPFLWSGQNQWDARKKGTGDFLGYLDTVAKAHPHEDLFIISHSHAGNLTKAALEQAVPEPPVWLHRVRGLICLATPYFDLTKREIAASAYAAGPFWIAAVGIMAIWMAALYAVASIVAPHSGYSTLDMWALVMVKSGFAAVLFILSLAARQMNENSGQAQWIDQAMDGMLSATSTTEKLPPSLRVLSLWTLGDEAYWGLRVVQLLLAIPYLLATCVAVVAFAAFPLFLILLALGTIGYWVAWLVNVIMGEFFSGDLGPLLAYSNFVIQPMKFLAAAMLGSGAVGLASLGLLHITAFFIRLVSSGREMNYLSYGLINLRIRRRITGAENVRVRASSGYWVALRHSVPWRDPAALQVVGEWISRHSLPDSKS